MKILIFASRVFGGPQDLWAQPLFPNQQADAPYGDKKGANDLAPGEGFTEEKHIRRLGHQEKQNDVQP